MRQKRTYNLPESTVRAVRELAAEHHVAPTQDGVIELAVDELARRVRDEVEARAWSEAGEDREYRAERDAMSHQFRSADEETWPR